MPIYEFSCSKCEHKIEKRMNVSDRREPITCSMCGSDAFRVASVPAEPRFKGEGWTPKFYEEK